MDEMDQKVVNALESFLRMPCQHEQKQEQQQRNQPRNEILASPSFSSSQSLFSQLSDCNQNPDDSREVILQNCQGEERLEYFIALLMETNSSLTFRYDKQQKLPIHIARGLQRGADHINDIERDDSRSQFRSLTLKGMTITRRTVSYLEMTLPLLPNLEELTLQGNFTLVELDENKSSIVGQEYSEMVHVVESLHNMLRSLPRLKYLDLQRCHLSDEFLADILEAVNPESLQTLKLNGNMAHEESQHIIHQILSLRHCQLQHLDLSWQRLSNAKRNYSILDLGMLSTVLANQNTSLRTLNLSENMLLDEDVAQLAGAVSRHPNLSRVCLQDCRISDSGMIALARVLPKCSERLKYLYLDGRQKIRDTTLVRKTIFQSLLKNVYLRELALPYNIQSDSANWALELNRAGRRALLEPDERDCPDPAIECKIHAAPSFDSQNGINHIPDSLWPCVLERADRIARQEYLSEKSSTTKAASAIYLLLREKGFQSIIR